MNKSADSKQISHFYKTIQTFFLFILAITSVSGRDNKHQKNEQWLQQQQDIMEATVLLNNKERIIPLLNLQQRIASVDLGIANAGTFDSLINKYTTVASFPVTSSDSAFKNLSLDLKLYHTVIVQVPAAALEDKRVLTFLQDVQKSKQLVLVAFGNPGSLRFVDGITHPIIWTTQDSPVAADFTAQLIFGGVAATGKLHARYSKKYRKKDGFTTSAIRLKYTVPEDAGLSISDIEPRVDSLANDAIQGKGAPAIVVMVLKDGKVIFNKGYGSHTYEGGDATRITDIFDMASITKVSATTMATMRLYEQKKIMLDSSFGYYMVTARNTNKSNIKIKDLLLHQSGIASGVGLPLLPVDFRADSSAEYPVKGGENVFIRKEYFNEVIWPLMLRVKVDTSKYVYSDLSMTYMKEVIENQSGTKLDDYVDRHFYAPLGMQRAAFNPLNRFSPDQIVPTEWDADFRKGLIHGYVHDPMAAKYGGVSGNAGLFASANDLAILYQMILNKGTYGGIRYFSPETVELFTSNQSTISRRGLGFDRVDTTNIPGYPSKLASDQTYGHTGFTGTCFWVDPKYNLVYIFLSNRVYPKVNNNLFRMRVQANILDTFYEAIIKRSGK